MKENNLLGKEIFGYTVQEVLGTGTFGTVYKVAKQNASGYYVRALKHITIPSEEQYESVLNSMGGDCEKANNYFEKSLEGIVREIRVLNELSEAGATHIVKYYENQVDVIDNPRCYDVYILMEYLSTLQEHIKANGFTVKNVVELGLDILEGLMACHSNGIIHRDIKEDNIFYSDKGGYKIGDFGVARIIKHAETAGAVKGTPNYIAPEIITNKDSDNKSVDLYALGIVLYRLLNYNRNPFLPHYPNAYTSQDEEEAYVKRINGMLPEEPCFGGDAIGRVIIKAISDKNTRYQSAENFHDALKSALQNTADVVLKQRVDIVDEVSSSAHTDISQATKYGATYNELVYCESVSNVKSSSRSLQNTENHEDINKKLFATIDEGSDTTKFGDLKNVRIVEDTQAEEMPSEGQSSFGQYFTKKWAMRGLSVLIVISIATYFIFSTSPKKVLKDYINAIGVADFGKAYQCLDVKEFPTLSSAGYLKFVEYARNDKDNNIYKLSQNELGEVTLSEGVEKNGILSFEAIIAVKRKENGTKLKYTVLVEKTKTGPFGFFTGYKIAGNGVYAVPKINCLTGTEQITIDNVNLAGKGDSLILNKPVFYGWHDVECKGKFYEPVKQRAFFDKASGMLQLDSKKFKLNSVANEALYEASKEFTALFLPTTLTDNGYKQCKAVEDEKSINDMYDSFNEGFKQVGVSHIKIEDGKILTSYAGANGNLHCQYQFFGVYEKNGLPEKKCTGTIYFEYVYEGGQLLVAKVNDYNIHLED